MMSLVVLSLVIVAAAMVIRSMQGRARVLTLNALALAVALGAWWSHATRSELEELRSDRAWLCGTTAKNLGSIARRLRFDDVEIRREALQLYEAGVGAHLERDLEFCLGVNAADACDASISAAANAAAAGDHARSADMFENIAEAIGAQRSCDNVVETADNGRD